MPKSAVLITLSFSKCSNLIPKTMASKQTSPMAEVCEPSRQPHKTFIAKHFNVKNHNLLKCACTVCNVIVIVVHCKCFLSLLIAQCDPSFAADKFSCGTHCVGCSPTPCSQSIFTLQFGNTACCGLCGFFCKHLCDHQHQHRPGFFHSPEINDLFHECLCHQLLEISDLNLFMIHFGNFDHNTEIFKTFLCLLSDNCWNMFCMEDWCDINFKLIRWWVH